MNVKYSDGFYLPYTTQNVTRQKQALEGYK